jgi:type IV fimbrial biogenesis protein FimT
MGLHDLPFIRTQEPFVDQQPVSNIPIVRINKPFVETYHFFGFTLIELMMVLTIAGVLAALAAPAMNTFIQSNRLATTTNDFIAALNLARSEALKRGTNAGICKSDNGSTCTATGTWSSGWIVFVDGDNSGAGAWTASDSLVRAHESLATGTAITGSDAILYNRQGQALNAPALYIVCNSNTRKSRIVNIGVAGRASISEVPC